jgi:hypothetical protein
VRLEKVSLLRNVLSIFREAFFVYGAKKIPSPCGGGERGPAPSGVQDEALNLMMRKQFIFPGTES